MIKQLEIIASRRFTKQLRKLPFYIKQAVAVWVASVEEDGLRAVRRLSGYHDEPLKGKRKGQRSVRLNKAYRLIYEVNDKGEITILTILEVNKHEY